MPKKGYKQTVEHKRKKSEVITGEKNPMYGKKRPDLSAINRHPDTRTKRRLRALSLGENHPMVSEYMLNGGSAYSNLFNNSPEQREKQSERMRNGGGAYVSSFNKSPSKPQVELFNKVKNLYPDAVLNYLRLNYCIDVAIPSLMVAVEYDGSYWHKDEEKDKKRQLDLESVGWKFLRYRDFVPDKNLLERDIQSHAKD